MIIFAEESIILNIVQKLKNQSTDRWGWGGQGGHWSPRYASTVSTNQSSALTKIDQSHARKLFLGSSTATDHVTGTTSVK